MKSDWNFIGTGGYAIILDSPSGSGTKAIQIMSTQRLIFNDNINIGNVEVVYWAKHNSSVTALYGELWARLQNPGSVDDGYVIRTYGANPYVYIYRAEGGSLTLLASTLCPLSLHVWRKLRVRVKGFVIEFSQWDGSAWVVVLTVTDITAKWPSGAIGIGTYRASGAFFTCFDDVGIGEET
jgi:hypothetical protein